MFNLRYHIVSIAAVFLALAIGLALGSTFVDSVLVSNLESQVDQLEADTRTAEEQRADAQAALADARAARAEALASVEAARAERFEIEDLVRPYLPDGRLSGTTTLIVSPDTVDRAAVAAIRSRLAATDTQLGGVLWLSEDLRFDDAAVRARTAAAYSLAGDGSAVLRRAMRFLIPQALFRPDEAGSAQLPSADAAAAAAPDAGALDGFTRGFGAVPRTRTALTVLRDLGLVSHDGTGAVALHLLGGEQLRLVVVTDAAAADLNEEFVFDLLAAVVDDGHTGAGVIVEVPALNGAGVGDGTLLERVRSDPVLGESFSTVDDVDSFSGDLALLVALERLPAVSHFSGADLNHGLGPP